MFLNFFLPECQAQARCKREIAFAIFHTAKYQSCFLFFPRKTKSFSPVFLFPHFACWPRRASERQSPGRIFLRIGLEKFTISNNIRLENLREFSNLILFGEFDFHNHTQNTKVPPPTAGLERASGGPSGAGGRRPAPGPGRAPQHPPRGRPRRGAPPRHSFPFAHCPILGRAPSAADAPCHGVGPSLCRRPLYARTCPPSLKGAP